MERDENEMYSKNTNSLLLILILFLMGLCHWKLNKYLVCAFDDIFMHGTWEQVRVCLYMRMHLAAVG